MPAAFVTGVIIGALLYILWAPLERALAAYLAVLVLLPGALLLPNALTSLLTVPRLTLFALGLRLLIAIRRKEASVDALRPTPVHALFYLFLGIALVNGVMLAAPTTSTTEAVSNFLNIVDQFLAFVIVLAIVRSLTDLRPLFKAFAVIIGMSAGIALLEKVSGKGWAHLVLENMPGQGKALNAFPLEQRGGGVRVRAAAEFGLQFGWISVMLLPFAAAVAVRSKRWTLRAIPFVLVATIYWSNTRSALAGVVLVLAILVVFGRDRRLIRVGLVCFAVGGLLWAVPSVRAPFKGYKQTGSAQIRSTRLPEIAAIVNHHPYGGLGLHGLDAFGFGSTDATWLLVYAELGVVGLAAFAALAIGLLIYSGQGLRGPPSSDSLFAAAAVAGVVGGLVGAAAVDLFSLAGSANLFWVIAAFAVALAGRRTPGLVSWRWSGWRLVVAPLGVVIGLVLAFAVPSHASVVTPFDSIPIDRVVTGTGDLVYNGGFHLKTFCGTATAIRLPAKAELECRATFKTPGFGELLIDAPTLPEARSATVTLERSLEVAVPGVRFHPEMDEVGRPTWARTAPVWLGVAWLLIAVFCPLPARRHRQRQRPPRVLEPV